MLHPAATKNLPDNFTGRVESQNAASALAGRLNDPAVIFVVGPLIFPGDGVREFFEADFPRVIALDLLLITVFDHFESKQNRPLFGEGSDDFFLQQMMPSEPVPLAQIDDVRREKVLDQVLKFDRLSLVEIHPHGGTVLSILLCAGVTRGDSQQCNRYDGYFHPAIVTLRRAFCRPFDGGQVFAYGTSLKKRIGYPQELDALVAQLKRFPGVGPRSAERMALWLIQGQASVATEIGQTIVQTRETVRPCMVCGFFATDERCEICVDTARDGSLLCVVEQATDVIPVERTGAYPGYYHCLGGRLAPLDHVGPDDLRIAGLMDRLATGTFREVILALSSDVEGEATANYLSELIAPIEGIELTRPAQGLPAGGGLDQADEVTLSRAFGARSRWGG